MDDVTPSVPIDTPAEPVTPPEEPATPAAPLDWGIAPAPSAPGEETLVIPPVQAAANPFIPQGVPTPTVPSGNNPFLKRILLILVLLVALAGIGLGVKYVLGRGGSGETTITYWGLWEDSPTMQTAITDFETVNPTIKVQYIKQSSQQYRERLQAAIDRGDGPDVFQFHNTWVPMFHTELAAAPTTLMTTTEFSNTFYPVASADLVGGQAIYGVPLMFDGLGLYYNQDLLTNAGVTPPTTWPELLDDIPKLTVKTQTDIQQSAIALGTTANVENFSDIIGLMLMQNGASLTNPTGKEAEDTLTFYNKFSNPTDPAYTWNETMDDSISAFANGKVAMILAPSWQAFQIQQINPNVHFKVAPVPQLPGNTLNWASYWAGGVSAKSKSQLAAWTFLKYLVDKNTLTKMYSTEAKSRLFGEIYPRVDLGSTLSSDPYVGAFVEEAPTAKSFPLASRTFDNGLNDKLIQYMTDAVNAVSNGTSPTGALQTASAGFSQVLTSYGLTTGVAPATTP